MMLSVDRFLPNFLVFLSTFCITKWQKVSRK